MNTKAQPQKIVFLINDITALGGTERMCSLIANKLAAIGFDVSVISQHQSQDVPFFHLDAKISRQQLLPQPKKPIHYLQLPFLIYQKIKQIQPNIVISCDTQLCLFSSVPLMNKNHIAWEHFNAKIFTRFGSRWFGRRLASILCKKIIVLTNSDKAHWIKTLQTSDQKITVIPNPIPIPINQKMLSQKTQKIVLAVGRMTEQKGFDLLIKAWLKISDESKKDWQLRIVGPAGSAKPTLEKLIQTHQLANQVQLVPAASKIEKEYQQACVYVMSSRYEGFGLTLVEAMGQGLPVIAFDCPMGPKEIIDDKYGKLVPALNIDELATCLSHFMLEPKLRAKYAKLAVAGAQKYSSENIIKQWQTMLTAME